MGLVALLCVEFYTEVIHRHTRFIRVDVPTRSLFQLPLESALVFSCQRESLFDVARGRGGG